jgi:hypothetical protein
MLKSEFRKAAKYACPHFPCLQTNNIIEESDFVLSHLRRKNSPALTKTYMQKSTLHFSDQKLVDLVHMHDANVRK